MTGLRPSPPSGRILTLPDEILQHIFEYLPTASRWAGCLVCVRFLLIAEPLLYRDIDWAWSIPDDPRQPALLLTTILDRPSLGAYVRWVSLAGHSRWHQTLRSTVTSAMIAKPKALVQSFGLPSAASQLWESSLEDGAVDALLAVLLLHLPRLEYLHLAGSFSHDSSFLISALAHACRGSLAIQSHIPSFKRLREVRLDHPRRETGFLVDGRKKLPLFYLPALQTLHATIEGYNECEWPMGVPDTSVLTVLHLNFAEEGPLGGILSAMRNLKTLRLTWHHRYRLMYEDTDTLTLNLDEIMEGLLLVKDTLEELHLLVGEKRTKLGFATFAGTKGSLDDLVRLGSLKIFTAAVPFLPRYGEQSGPGLECFPSNLEILTVTDGLSRALFRTDWKADRLQEIARLWADTYERYTPRLKRIEFQPGYDPHECDQKLQENMQALSAELEILVEFLIYPPGPFFRGYY